jgi:hypothetical protein
MVFVKGDYMKTIIRIVGLFVLGLAILACCSSTEIQKEISKECAIYNQIFYAEPSCPSGYMQTFPSSGPECANQGTIDSIKETCGKSFNTK